MQDSHIDHLAQGGNLTNASEHRAKVAQIFARGRSPRVEELIGYTEAARLTGLAAHQLQYATAKGELIAVPLPNGKTALIDSQLRAWAKARERRQ